MSNDKIHEGAEKIGLMENAGGIGDALLKARRQGMADKIAMGCEHRIGEDGTPYAVIQTGPERFEIQSLRGYEGPRRSAMVTVDEVGSLLGYLERFQDERTQLFCDMQHHGVLAILDYHFEAAAEGQSDVMRAAERGEHRALLRLKLTREMEQWQRYNGTALEQAEWAEFLEDRAYEVIDPGPADILEIAKTLEMKPNIEFKSSQRKHDGGYDLHYVETAGASAGTKGDLEVPERIKLRLPIFQGGHPVELEARLRYRMTQGQLQFSYRFIRFEEAVREQLEKIREHITDVTGLPVYSGKVDALGAR